MANDSELSRSSPTAGERLRRAAPLLLLLAVAVFFGEALVTGRVPAMRDLVADFVPWREYAAGALADGSIPLWNPHSRCGQPFLANPQSAVLYPPHLLFLVLPAAAALTASLVLHTLLLVGSVYALARRFQLDRGPALAAAAGIGFGTYTVAMMEFLTSFTTVVWLPLTWLAADALVRAAEGSGSDEPSWRSRVGNCAPAAAALTLLFAVQALAGHGQSLLQNVVLVVAFAVVRALATRDRRAVLATLGGIGVAAVLSMFLTAPQLLPTWDLLELSTRAQSIDPGMAEASVHPSHLLTLFLPTLFGGPGYAGEWWNAEVYEYWASTSYVGVAPLVLLPFLPLLWLRRETPRLLRVLAVFFAGVAVLGLLLAFGRRTPLYPFLVEHVPLFDRFRWPGKLLHYVAFSLPLLGALGFHASLRAGRRWLFGVAGAWAAVWLGLVGLRVAGVEFVPDGGDVEQAAHAATWLLVVLGACAAGVALLAAGGRKRAVGIALLVLTAVADPAIVSRRTLPFMDADVYSSVPGWIDEYRASPPGRVHGIYQKSQILLYGTRDPTLLRWAREAAVGEALLPLGVDRTWGFGQLPLRRWAEAWTLLDDPALDALSRQRLADAMNVRFVVHGARFDEATLRGGVWPELRWSRQAGCAPRARVAATWLQASGADDARRLLLGGAATVLHAETGADGAGEDGAPGSPGPDPRGAAAGAVTSVTYDWNRVTVDVVMQRDGLLVLADTWHPGWTARVDGVEARVLHANWLFRGVLLSRGARRVEMTYVDPAFRAGLIYALVAGVCLVLLLLAGRRLRRRSDAG